MRHNIFFLSLLSLLIFSFYSCGGDEEGGNGEDEGGHGDSEPTETLIFETEDIVMNPANSGGKRIIVIKLAIEVESASDLETLEQKKMILDDLILSTVSSKTVGQLSQSSYKDSIKTELGMKIEETMGAVSIKNVYITKYILQ